MCIRDSGGPVVSDDIPITMIVRVIEGVDPELGTRADARRKQQEDFEANEAFKKNKH